MGEAGIGVGIVPESAAQRYRKITNFVIKQLDEDWAVRERHVLSRLGDSLPGYTVVLIDSLMNCPAHVASRSDSAKPRKRLK